MGSFVKISTIEQATATAGPGDVIALTAENYVSSTSTTFWVYGQTTSGNADWVQATAVSNASAGVNTEGEPNGDAADFMKSNC
jgi:hypothetical protein